MVENTLFGKAIHRILDFALGIGYLALIIDHDSPLTGVTISMSAFFRRF